MKLKISKKVRKWVTFGVIVVVLAAGGYIAYKQFSPKPAVAQVITTTVQKGDVKQVITATGTANYKELDPITFQQGAQGGNNQQLGKVSQILVAVGDKVKAGQPLAKLDTSTLQQSVASAQVSLTSAEAALQQDLTNTSQSTQENLVKAQQALLTAQQAADTNYLADQVYLAQQNVLSASNALAQAEAAGSTNVAQMQTALSQAQSALTTAKNAQNGGAAQNLAVAQEDYNVALQQYNTYKQGDSSTILAAQASVSQNQVQLANAEQNLADATLTSPVDGVVVTNSLTLGETVSTSTAAMSIAGSNQNFEVDASVDQSDINNIKVGQNVDLTLDSAPNVIMHAKVTSIPLQGTTVQNVTTYDVVMDVTPPAPLLKDGMSVNVSIITNEALGVLTVPDTALITRGTMTGVLIPASGARGSGSTGAPQVGSGNGSARYGSGSRSFGSGSGAGNGAGYGASGSGAGNRAYGSGNGAAGGGAGRYAGRSSATGGANVRFVPIQVGIDDGTNTQVKSGLTEGEVIVLQIKTSTTAAASANGAAGSAGANPGRSIGALGGGFGGGGFRGGGGGGRGN
ncbi:MAG: HlyD family efflux transporter periplasmic adaptor subunit [Peptococcaceae bacterium]|nr:HlyD family efflux transporter periplasmic adaptor subunit [Peptococcaceae bacterium]